MNSVELFSKYNQITFKNGVSTDMWEQYSKKNIIL